MASLEWQFRCSHWDLAEVWLTQNCNTGDLPVLNYTSLLGAIDRNPDTDKVERLKVWRSVDFLLLIIYILHDLIYQNPRTFGSTWYIRGDAGFTSSAVDRPLLRMAHV